MNDKLYLKSNYTIYKPKADVRMLSFQIVVF